MRAFNRLSGYVIKRISFAKKDAIDIFTHENGKIRCWLAISLPFYHRLDEADFCEIEVSESKSGSVIVTSLLRVKTPTYVRQDPELFECWNGLAELIDVCVERESQDTEIFPLFKKCFENLSRTGVADFVREVAALLGVARRSEPLWSAILALEDYSGKPLNVRKLFDGSMVISKPYN